MTVTVAGRDLAFCYADSDRVTSRQEMSRMEAAVMQASTQQGVVITSLTEERKIVKRTVGLKTRTLLKACSKGLERNIFEEITITSHTHNDVDWIFGIIAQNLKKIDLYGRSTYHSVQSLVKRQLQKFNFKAFDFDSLKCQPSPAAVPDHSQLLQSKSSVDVNVSVTATFYPLDMSTLSAMDLKKDVSLVLYTETKKWRPWVCLFVELSEDGLSVTVQWVKKENQKHVLHLNRDGSPYLSSVPVDSIMFADVIENLSPEDAREGLYKVSNFVKQEIDEAYEEHNII